MRWTKQVLECILNMKVPTDIIEHEKQIEEIKELNKSSKSSRLFRSEKIKDEEESLQIELAVAQTNGTKEKGEKKEVNRRKCS